MIIDPTRKPNVTPAARHYTSSKPVMERHILPPAPTSKYQRPMSRMSFGVFTAKEDRTIRSLYDLLATGKLASSYLFPDTGFITTEIQEQFWEFGASKTFAFTEMTVAELSGWLSYPMHNAYLQSWLPRALDKCKTDGQVNGPFRLSVVQGLVQNRLTAFRVGVLVKSEMTLFGYDHYVNLLSVRKLVGVRVARELAGELGREPLDSEMHNRLKRDYSSRIAPIAFKGWKDRGKPNFLADEELVVSAIITAIMTGQTTTILTRDNDVFDLFVKMCELLTGDYMCYRFGLYRHFNPNGVSMGKLPIHPSEKADQFGFVGTQVEHVVIPHREAEELPPYQYTPVHCFCVLVGNHCEAPKISISGFCLERELSGLLHTKKSTNGKNSGYFDERNVVLGSTGKSREELALLFTLVEEKPIEYEGISLTKIDLLHAIKDDMPIIKYVWDEK